MASGKRASMREGPLAALFRRTDESDAPAEDEPREDTPAEPGERRTAAPTPEASSAPPAAPPPAATHPAGPPAPHPATAAGQGRGPAAPAETPARAPGPEAPRPDREPPAHPRDTGYPHPSLGATPEPVTDPEVRVPSPQERLRHAFSSDIPENMLEPPVDAPPPVREPRTVPDEPVPWGEARAVGSPVIRVIGVGGAGVNAVN